MKPGVACILIQATLPDILSSILINDHDLLLLSQEEKANAKDLHPKLLAGMFFFFALGATGGVTSLLTSDKPIFERYT